MLNKPNYILSNGKEFRRSWSYKVGGGWSCVLKTHSLLALVKAKAKLTAEGQTCVSFT